MPTPSSKAPGPACDALIREWAARPATSPRSVFANYSRGTTASPQAIPQSPHAAHRQVGVAERCPAEPESLQRAIDMAMARSFVYRFLAQAYEDPTAQNWAWMSAPESQGLLRSAIRVLAMNTPSLQEAAAAFSARLKAEGFEPFLDSCLAAFGHAARGRCPLNEIEYGDLKADPLFQPHRLADLAAFYRAFGLEVANEADERHDHLCLELEFLCVLAAKEAYALEHQLAPEDLSICRDAQRGFLRDHLGRWTPAFARRLARMAGDNTLGALANFTRAFVEAECARHGISPGSEDLLLRPVDQAAESLCHSCSPAHLPPGATG